MTDILVKLFVRDHQNIEDPDVRAAYGVLAGVVGIVCNVLLSAAKGLIGFLSGSIAVFADAFNNLTDAVSSIISLIGAKLARRPADKEHPFGHGRYEYIAALVVAFLVIDVGLSCARNSFEKILHPEALAVGGVTFAVLTISILVKAWLGLFNRRLGKRINSSVMRATAADAMGDVLTTAATLAAMVVYHFFDRNIDGIVGLIVALIVIWEGVGIVRDTLKPLLGERPDPQLAQKITQMVESYDGIYGSHDLIIHNYGPTRSMATIHAEVSNSADIEQTHELIDRIEREVTRVTGVFLVIHMDPVETKDRHVLRYQRMVGEILRQLDENIRSHDFHMIDDGEQITLAFDVVVPYTYHDEEKNALLHRIIEEVQQYDPRCACIITIENSFTADIPGGKG